MRSARFLSALAIVALGAVGHSQTPPSLIPPPSPKVADIQPPKVAPAEPSVDQMLDALEALQLKKAEIEKQQKELIGAIEKKADAAKRTDAEARHRAAIDR